MDENSLTLEEARKYRDEAKARREQFPSAMNDRKLEHLKNVVKILELRAGIDSFQAPILSPHSGWVAGKIGGEWTDAQLTNGGPLDGTKDIDHE